MVSCYYVTANVFGLIPLCWWCTSGTLPILACYHHLEIFDPGRLPVNKHMTTMKTGFSPRLWMWPLALLISNVVEQHNNNWVLYKHNSPVAQCLQNDRLHKCQICMTVWLLVSKCNNSLCCWIYQGCISVWTRMVKPKLWAYILSVLLLDTRGKWEDMTLRALMTPLTSCVLGRPDIYLI